MGRRGESAVQESPGDGRFDVDVLPVNHSRQHTRYRNVEKCTNQQRHDNADG